MNIQPDFTVELSGGVGGGGGEWFHVKQLLKVTSTMCCVWEMVGHHKHMFHCEHGWSTAMSCEHSFIHIVMPGHQEKLIYM